MIDRTSRFEMRTDSDFMDRVDRWRSEQPDVPNRSEAARRLMELGLERSNEVRFSAGEKLIVAMLSDLLKANKVDSEIDPKFIMSAIYGGHYWALNWELSGLFHDHEDRKQVVSFVVDVLDMWDFIETGYSRLSDGDKLRVETEAAPFGKHVAFRGFDGNNETTYMSVARFLIGDMGRFQRFKGRELNSHMPMIDGYQRMFRAFEPMRAVLTGGELNATQIIQLLQAKTHPSRRGAAS
ncbi:MAG: YfbU family protein [Allorhizobium sp.]|nr:MAG: hypothetical protein B7Z40_08715 [Bosea sp. 12-68-7]